MSTKPFKFVISGVRRNTSNDGGYQMGSIYASYPTFVYHIETVPGINLSTDEQVRLAVSELKVRLIQEISNAEFEYE